MPNQLTTIGIITYDFPHLKTEQIVTSLLLRNGLMRAPRDIDIKLFALPFSPRPERQVLLKHRPDQSAAAVSRDLARAYNIEFIPCTYNEIPDLADYYVIAGAGILSSAAIGRKKIINAHPGIIPAARGLDAFKWSILHGVQLGVTLHFVDSDVDSGDVIAIVETPVLPEDDIVTLARRHYELEIEMLVNFRALLQVGGADRKQYPEHPARMRMPRALEKEMLERFETYKEEFSAESLSRWRQQRVADTA